MNIEYKKIENIYCKYFYPKNKVENTLVAIHGFAGDKESSAIKAVAKELNNTTLVVAFDLFCHGEDCSNKQLDLKKCLEYVNIVIENTKNEYSKLPISIFATSFGAYLFLTYLKNSTCSFDHIILRSPAIFMDEILVNSILIDHKLSLDEMLAHSVNLGYNKEILVDKNFLQALKNNQLTKVKFSQHIDIIQGDCDDVVDIKKNEKFYNSNFLEYDLHYIKGADHRFKKSGELEQILNIVKNIIR